MEDIDIVDCKYTLLVKDGTYFANSIIGLFWEMLKHRLEHLRRDGKWMD